MKSILAVFKSTVLWLILFVSLTACSISHPFSIHQATPTRTITKTLWVTSTTTNTPTPTETPTGPQLIYLSEMDGNDQIFLLDTVFGTEVQLTDGTGISNWPGWTPDGWQIVYQYDKGLDSTIHIMDWNGENDVQLSKSNDSNDVNPVISPDGNTIAYFCSKPGYWGLFLMNIDGINQHMIKGQTVFDSIASWSPDGNTIAFTPWHNTMNPPFIATVGMDGEQYAELTDGKQSDYNPIWSPIGDKIAYVCYINHTRQICTMNPNGNNRIQLTQEPGGNINPVWSPDGSKIAFVSWRDTFINEETKDEENNIDVYIMDADGSNQQRITTDPKEDWYPAWSPDGKKLAFVSMRHETRDQDDCEDKCNTEIYMVDIDGNNLTRLTDNSYMDYYPIWRPEVSTHVARIVPTKTPSILDIQFGSSNDQIMYFAQDNQDINLYLINLDGQSETGKIIGEGSEAVWSPDGKSIAFVNQYQIYIMDADGNNIRQLTNISGHPWRPAWSPDGQKIAFVVSGEIFTINIDGTDQEKIDLGEGSFSNPAWSSDGTRIAYMKDSDGFSFAYSLYVANIDGSERSEITNIAYYSTAPDWSPNDQWIAYDCYEEDWQVCLITPDGSQQKILTHERINGEPHWSPDGKWITFISYRDENWEVYIMQADGSNQTRITNDWLSNFNPVWKPAQ